MRNIPDESWDSYKLRIFSRIERVVAWTAILLGAIIILLYAVYEAIEAFLRDTATPKILKYGIVAMVTGVFILLVSVIREKLFVRKRDPYKEVER